MPTIESNRRRAIIQDSSNTTSIDICMSIDRSCTLNSSNSLRGCEGVKHACKSCTDMQVVQGGFTGFNSRIPSELLFEEDCDKGDTYYCEKDIRIQIVSVDRLLQTGWYYEGMSSPEAKRLLRNERVGTFIIRDSSDPRFLYSVSVKTPRGTTSVRIIYSKGVFLLDCEDKIRNKMPRFDCVVQLVDFYVRLSLSDRHHICRWLESSGRKDLPIQLQKPRLNAVLDLKHACRLTINRSLPLTTNTTKVKKFIDDLPIPTPIKTYIKDYPYLH